MFDSQVRKASNIQLHTEAAPNNACIMALFLIKTPWFPARLRSTLNN
jgi:hypothetical protein